MKNIFVRKAAVLCILPVLLSLAGCSRSENAADMPASRVAAVMSQNSKTHATDFWTYVWDGLHDTADAENIALSEYVIDGNTSVESCLNLAIAAEVEGIIAALSDGANNEELLSLLREARAKDMKIVAVDTDVGEKYYDVFVGIDNEAAGVRLAEYVWEESEEEGQILILEPEASGAVSQRIEGFCDYFEKMGAGEGRISFTALRDKSEERLMDIQKAIDDTENLQWIVSFDPSSTIQAAETLSRMKLTGEIALVGFGESDTAEEYLEEGIINALLIQDNVSIGVLAAEKMSALLAGETLEETHYYVDFSLIESELKNESNSEAESESGNE